MQARAGSELTREGIYKHTKALEYGVNIILSRPNPYDIVPDKINILLQQQNHYADLSESLRNPLFADRIDATVYVSHWQMEKFRERFRAPLRNAYVIRNAIEPIEFIPRTRTDKLKLIYTSMPHRGLEMLLNIVENSEKNFELDVYSSLEIYGSEFAKKNEEKFEKIFEKARTLSNVNYHGYASNEQVRKALHQAHVFAYPSIFEETSCVSMIEAAAAGCSLVTTNLGALPETGGVYAQMSPIQYTQEDTAITYRQMLENAIDYYWNDDNQQLIRHQSNHFNTHYSWESVAPQWNALFEKIAGYKE